MTPYLPRLLAAGALAACATAATPQASYDLSTQVLAVPTVDVAGHLYRDLRLRLDADGRLSLRAITPPPPAIGPDLAQRSAAAASTATSHPLCMAIRPFYWEIGDKTARLAGGSVSLPGSAQRVDANTFMSIASASKWLYGAYVAERRNGVLTAEDVRFLTFTSGYTSFAPNGCEPRDTVASCLARENSGVLTPENMGKFFYNGAQMQKHASLPAPGMALGAMDNAALAAEMRRVLGTEINLAYNSPQLAGGVQTTAADYATFLRKVLDGRLKISAWLGSRSVCTNPLTCSTAIATPIPSGWSWHYAIGHWVEDDPAADGATSSAGAFGFYPWIDAQKGSYGVIARVDFRGAAVESATCGAELRRAWATGQPSTGSAQASPARR